MSEQANETSTPTTMRGVAPPASGDGLFDAKGRWIPKRLIKDVDLARDEIVRELAAKAMKMSVALAAFKQTVMGDLQAFLELSAQMYGAELGGAKGNVTLMTYDGKYKVVRATSDLLSFDERLLVAKGLIDKCIHEWSEGSSDEIRVLVDHAFQVDKTGKVSAERVLGLRKLNIDHPTWKEAVRAIADSVQVAATRSYFRIYERDDETGEYSPIPLDLTGV